MIRILRVLLIPIVVLAALFLVGNVVVERVAEGRIASAVQREFKVKTKPTVDIHGFPIIVRLLQGRLPHLSFSAEKATFHGLSIASVSASLDDLSAPDGFLSSALSIIVGSGRIEARATQGAVNAYLRAHGETATIAFHDGGASVRAVRSFLGAAHTFTASGTVVREGGNLVFHPSSVRIDGRVPQPVLEAAAKLRATVRVKLPDLPGGIESYHFDPHRGTLSIVAEFHHQRVDLSG
jgi:hypothetical protein